MIMATNTALFETGIATREVGAEARPSGFFDGLFERFVARRSAQTERRIKAYLARYDDARLTEFGYSADEIADIRRHAGIAVPHLFV
jgi:hypothetical protein